MTLDGFLSGYFLFCGALAFLGVGKSLYQDNSNGSAAFGFIWAVFQFTLMYLVWNRT